MIWVANVVTSSEMKSLIVTGILLGLVHMVVLQTCESKRKLLNFKRVLLFQLKWNPKPYVEADKTSLQRRFGNCSVELASRKMVPYMESYGFNMTSIAKEPFRKHETDVFTITPLYLAEDAPYFVTLSSQDNAAELLNSRVYAAAWLLQAKQQVRGSRSITVAGTAIVFGNYRFRYKHKEECIQITRYSPPSPPDVRIIPVNLDLYHEEWGPGVSRGLDMYNEDRTERHLFHILTFPPDA